MKIKGQENREVLKGVALNETLSSAASVVRGAQLCGLPNPRPRTPP